MVVGYLYYEGQDIDLNGTVVTGVTNNDTTKKTSPPGVNMPRRNQTFYIEDGYQPTVNAVKGLYNIGVGGVKAYGNPVQSSSAMAITLDSGSATCVTNRTMWIAVTSTSGTVASINLQLSAVNISTASLPAQPANNNGNGTSGSSNAMNFSGFLGITLMSIFYMFY